MGIIILYLEFLQVKCMKNKKIFLYNDIPEGLLYDEIAGFSPIVINGVLDLVK